VNYSLSDGRAVINDAASRRPTPWSIKKQDIT